MSIMESEEISESVTIYFEHGEKFFSTKPFLIKHSSYFEAMFNGQFMESQSACQVTLKDISIKGFTGIINSLKANKILYDSLEDLLFLLETAQFLQFTILMQEMIELIEEKYLLTVNVFLIYGLASRLGLMDLMKKARVAIQFNFKTLLDQNRAGFFELPKEDLKELLNENGLNVNDETDVYDLVVEWCLETKNIDIEYRMVVDSVRFDSMNKNQLQHCSSKTKNLNLKKTIKKYIRKKNKNSKRPVRSVPYVLCTVRNDDDGYAFIYSWDWATKKFIQFLKLDPLPPAITGYHVVVKDMNIFVVGGEIGLGKGSWNMEGWKFNMISKKWRKLENFAPTQRRHGIGCFCGDDLILIGGLTKYRLPNDVLEKFKMDNDNDALIHVNTCLKNPLNPRIDRVLYICLEYKGHLVMISKTVKPVWCELTPGLSNPTNYRWNCYSMDFEDLIVYASSYLDYIYLIALKFGQILTLYRYCPTDQSSEELVYFKAKYEIDSTMCAININKVMVFSEDFVEYYNVDDHTYEEYPSQQDSFVFNHFFSLPIY